MLAFVFLSMYLALVLVFTLFGPTPHVTVGNQKRYLKRPAAFVFWFFVLPLMVMLIFVALVVATVAFLVISLIEGTNKN